MTGKLAKVKRTRHPIWDDMYNPQLGWPAGTLAKALTSKAAQKSVCILSKDTTHVCNEYLG